MSWNDPGNDRDKDKDPWGGNRGDQGPPDLDEAFRKFQGTLSSIFGGGGSGGGRFSVSPAILGIAAVVAAILYGIAGIYQVDEQERGVVLRFGALTDEIVLPGLRWNPPIIDKVIRVNVTQVRYLSKDASMLTEDDNIVRVSLTVQWVVGDPKNYVAEVRTPEQSLDHATESALRHVVGGSAMHVVLTEGREEVAVGIQERIQTYMQRYGTGISITKVNIDDATPPQAVQDAFDDVVKAKEDEQRVKNEADAYRNQIIPEARGEAQQQLEESNAYREQVVARAQGEASRFGKLLTEYTASPDVTRTRLYLDMMQKVMESSTKVMVDVEGGGNILYLPLDKLLQNAPASGGSDRLNTSDISNITDQVLREVQQRTNANRRGR